MRDSKLRDSRMLLDSSRDEDMKSVNDLVSLDDFPWQH